MTVKAFIIGEARGKNEEAFRHGFVGTSGQELARMVGEAGLCPSLKVKCKYCDQQVVFGRCDLCGTFNGVNPLEMIRFWAIARNHGLGITNVFHEHPDQDNIELFFGSKADPDVDQSLPPYKRGSKNFYVKQQYRHWLDDLWQEIDELKPNILIPMGNTACWAVFGRSKISDLRGTITYSVMPPGIKSLPTYHPAALRAWDLRPIIVSDLKKAQSESYGQTFIRDKRWILTDPTLEEIEKWFSVSTPRFSVDIESAFIHFSKAELGALKKHAPKLRQILAALISMVGFGRNESQALVIPFTQRSGDDLLPYWPHEWQEVRAWQWVQHGLSTGAELVFQNGLYDVNRLLHYGMRPKNMRHDTMLLHHSMFPEMLKSLGFQASIYSNSIAWKTMYGQGETLKRDD